jgi:hemolysin III
VPLQVVPPLNEDEPVRLERRVKPKWRGVQHQFAFFVALGAGAVLVAMAPPGRATWGALVFVLSLDWLLGVSALYHRPMWPLHVRERLKHFDHASIFVLIAGTYTPVCLLALPAEDSRFLLTCAWVGAGLGVLSSLLWVRRPRVVTAILSLSLGWLAVVYVEPIYRGIAAVPFWLVVAGGVLYTLGAIGYALRRPNPWPGHFGYHEVFHTLVVLAAGTHFAAILMLVLGERAP